MERRLPKHADLVHGDHVLARQNLQQRRLAGAVCADQQHAAALPQLQVHVVQHRRSCTGSVCMRRRDRGFGSDAGAWPWCRYTHQRSMKSATEWDGIAHTEEHFTC